MKGLTDKRMSRTNHQSATLGDALLLRAWTLDLLIKGGPATRPLANESGAADSLGTWELFLRTERCSLPLRSRLAAESPSPLAVGTAQLLERLATIELQHALSARGQLLEIRQLAAAHSLEPIVLKGGVAALSDDDPVDLADVDVLLPPDQAELLASLLNERGYRSAIAGNATHLPPRLGPEAVPIEVHFAINDLNETGALRARARPFPGFPGLWRLSPSDHLWHVLVHSAVTHPYRRGCIRDLLLIRSAVQQCSSAELEVVTSRIATHSRSGPLGAMLALAQAVGTGVATIDGFRREAAANYLLRDRFSWVTHWPILQPISTTVFVLLGSRWDREAEWAEVLRRREHWEQSSWKLLAALQRRSPWLGDMTRRLLRTGRLVIGRLLVWPLAASARRLAQTQDAPPRARRQATSRSGSW